LTLDPIWMNAESYRGRLQHYWYVVTSNWQTPAILINTSIEQGRSKGRRGGKTLRKNFPPFWKNMLAFFTTIGHSLKNLHPLRKKLLPTGFPSFYMSAIKKSSLCKNRGLNWGPIKTMQYMALIKFHLHQAGS